MKNISLKTIAFSFFALFLAESKAQCVASTCAVANQTDLIKAINYANANDTRTTSITINLTAHINLALGWETNDRFGLPPILSNVNFAGNGFSITGNGNNRIFFVGVDAATQANFAGTNTNLAGRQTVKFSNITLTGGNAQGGNGSGGGMGAGGAIFVNASANVTAENVNLTNNTARGGNGGIFNLGGGGMGGTANNWGGGGLGAPSNGTGGGGIAGTGADGGGGYSNSATGNTGGTNNLALFGITNTAGSDAGGGVPPIPSGFGGGGGGLVNGTGGNGSAGGFGGGGGAGGNSGGGFGGGGGYVGTITLGHGGFGGGGGGASMGNSAGNGGFGGGGGSSDATGGGTGGFGAGNGTAAKGGGGAGMGGAVFVVEGGSLTMMNTTTNTNMSGNLTYYGLGANNGNVGPGGIALQGNGTLNFNQAAGTTATINNSIGDQTGGNAAVLANGGFGMQNFSAGSYNAVKAGAGTLILNQSLALAGGVQVQEGRLQIGSGGTTGAVFGDINVSAGATLSVSRNNAFTLQNNISGAGRLVQSGTGTTTLTGVNTYSGGTYINGGRLVVANDALLGASTGSLNFNGGTLFGGANFTTTKNGIIGANGAIIEASNSTFGGVFSGVGGMTFQGLGSTTLTGNNIYNGNTIASNALNLGNGGASGSVAGNIVLNNGSLNINRSDVYTLSNVISGIGNISQSGAGTTILTSTTSNSGTTSVNAGTLLINGSNVSNSSTIVNSGATLGGIGTLGNTVLNGGILNPGASNSGIGTITVNGNLVATNGTYAVNLTNTTRDLTNVSGTANLGGTLNVIAAAGTYIAGSYTLLHSTGGLSGTFGNVSYVGSFGNLAPTINYINGQDVVLTLANLSIAANLPAVSGSNLANIASALDRAIQSGYQSPIMTAIMALPSANLPAALAQITGEGAGSASSAALAGGGGFARGLTGEKSNMVAVGGGAATAAREMSTHRPTVLVPVITQQGQWYGWTQASIAHHVNAAYASTGSHTTTITPIGAMTGMEYRKNAAWTFGFALQGGGFGYKLADNLGTGSGSNALLGGYARYSFNDYNLTASTFTGWQGFESNRTINIGGITEQLSGSSNGLSFGGRVELVKALSLSPTMSLFPYAALQVQNFWRNGYSEKGVNGSAETMALTFAARNGASVKSEMGLGFSLPLGFATGKKPRLTSRIGWAHEFSQSPTTLAAFKHVPAVSFYTSSSQANRDSLLVSSGLEMAWSRNVNIKSSLSGEFTTTSRSLSADIGVKWAW